MDPVLQARLDRLHADRAQRSAATSSSAPAARAAAGRSRKRHAAKGSRAAAALMSVATTVGLAAWFQHAEASGSVSSVAPTASGVSSTRTSATGSSTATSPSSAGTPATATSPTSIAPRPTAAGSTPRTPTTPTTPTTATSPATSTASASSTGLADGTYTGDTDVNRWGPVQVQITVAGGQISDVTTLQTPSDDRKSVRINQRAVPVLTTEALSAQSARIDTVSGATYTSDSYQASLQSAIDQAQAAAGASS